MLHVDLDNIITQDELASKAEEVLHKADDEGKIVVITRNGRPAVAVIKVEQLEQLSGKTVSTNQPPVTLPNVEAGAPSIPSMSTPPATSTEPAPTEPETPPTPPVAEQPNPSGLPDMPQ